MISKINKMGDSPREVGLSDTWLNCDKLSDNSHTSLGDGRVRQSRVRSWWEHPVMAFALWWVSLLSLCPYPWWKTLFAYEFWRTGPRGGIVAVSFKPLLRGAFLQVLSVLVCMLLPSAWQSLLLSLLGFGGKSRLRTTCLAFGRRWLVPPGNLFWLWGDVDLWLNPEWVVLGGKAYAWCKTRLSWG